VARQQKYSLPWERGLRGVRTCLLMNTSASRAA
jgi:hypothetical protein